MCNVVPCVKADYKTQIIEHFLKEEWLATVMKKTYQETDNHIFFHM